MSGSKKAVSTQLRHKDSGDGWVETSRGRFWGHFGAAGLLIFDPARGVLLQHRVSWSAHGDTWGVPGGARNYGESAQAAAIRECHEEAGVPDLDGGGIEVVDTHTLDMRGWSYVTVVARATRQLDAFVNDRESVELRWVAVDAVDEYELHPGFAKTWPLLKISLIKFK